MTVDKLPVDISVESRLLNRADIFLGWMKEGREDPVRATIEVSWLSGFRIFFWEVVLDGRKEAHDQFRVLLGANVKIVPDIFDATREAIVVTDNLTLLLHERAETIGLLNPQRQQEE